MVKIISRLFLLFFLQSSLYSYAEDTPTLTLDEFFDYVEYPTLSFSPTGQQLLIVTLKPSWNTTSYTRSLWLYEIEQEQKNLIADNISGSLTPIWSPSGKWVAFFTNNDSLTDGTGAPSEKAEQYLYLYLVATGKVFSVGIGSVRPSALSWSDEDETLYYTSATLRSKEEKDSYKSEWNGVINYRHSNSNTTIHRIDINTNGSSLTATTTIVVNVSFLIGELLYVPFEQQLVFNSKSKLYEDLDNFEIYSIHLNNPTSSLLRLTSMEGVEQELQLSSDGKHVLFLLQALSSGKVQATQQRIFSLDLTNGDVERLGKDFGGMVTRYKVKPDGGVYLLGQLGLQVQIYTQESSIANVIHRHGWNGTYEQFASSSHNASGPLAFAFSSFGQPKEVYLAKSIAHLLSAKAVTNHNELFTRRSLPQSKAYRWTNTADKQDIEGVLHYPPGLFETKNLPLLVLIHGGPNSASLNELQANWYYCALMAATEGWLVLEPNYRGSTGYGDKFLREIRSRLLSLPGQDILMGVDQLVKEGIADSKRLAVGGYSYGGFLTNWLITQTTRFNAALSGAGDVEHVSGWGTMDLPVLVNYLHGGFPWEVSTIYQRESPIYNLNKVRTPTHIVTGESDVRVKAEQSYMLERGLHYLGIPVQLLVFPNEEHDLEKNPWNGKIKVREELKWLQKYGGQSWTNGCSTLNKPFIVLLSICIIKMWYY